MYPLLIYVLISIPTAISPSLPPQPDLTSFLLFLPVNANRKTRTPQFFLLSSAILLPSPPLPSLRSSSPCAAAMPCRAKAERRVTKTMQRSAAQACTHTHTHPHTHPPTYTYTHLYIYIYLSILCIPTPPAFLVQHEVSAICALNRVAPGSVGKEGRADIWW